jgi:integrase
MPVWSYAKMPLTDVTVRTAKPRDKIYKLSDSGGLYVEVTPAGGKRWRWKYRIGGREKLLSMGLYPAVPLAAARARRDDAKKLLASGVDPSVHRQAAKAAQAESAAHSFEVIAREWFVKHQSGWAESHSSKVMTRLEKDVFPFIGLRPIAEINAPELLKVFQRIEERGALETAHKARFSCGQVFRYAIATGRAERDISADLRGALPPVRTKHMASVTDPALVGPLLRALHGYQGTFTVRCALRLAPLLFVRPGELRTAQWADIDLGKAEWRYLVTKTKTDHVVPLATQAIQILRELQPLTGSGRYVFPGARSMQRPMSENTVNAALRRLGIPPQELTGHGFRAMARTILDEVHEVRIDFIEHQLAHEVKDPLGRAYNRTSHLPARRKMMQMWADYLDQLRAEVQSDSAGKLPEN